MIRTFALFTLLTLGGCASSPPEFLLTRTVPPKFNIIPAKSVAVIGQSQKAVDPHEDEFIDLVVSKLRGYEQYDVKDERGLARGKGWQTYLAETAGDVIVRISVPNETCEVSEEDDEDTDVVIAQCWARLDLFKPRTGDRLGSVNAEGYGRDADQRTALADAMDDAASEIIGGFAPRQFGEFVALDQDAPLVNEGLAKFESRDSAGAFSLWESALTTSPNSAPLLYNLGALCEATNDPRAARAYYSRAIAIAPPVQRYRKALARLNR